MNNINFRDKKLFNPAIQIQLNDIYNIIHRKTAFLDKKILKDLLSAFTAYYQNERKRDYSRVGATIRATEVFSQFIQNLIYYIFHAVPGNDQTTREYKIKQALALISHELFFYRSNNNYHKMVWSDPKEEKTVLNSACQSGHANVANALLQAAEQAYGGKTTPGFQAFLEHPNKDGFSPLNSAACAGHLNVANVLLQAAEQAYGGKNTPGFQAFLEHPNKDGFSPLNSAACVGHLNVANVLLQAAEQAYGGKNTPGFQAFLEHPNKDGFSPLNSAACAGHLNVANVLLQAGELAHDRKSSGFKTFLEQPNRYGFTPLNAVCHTLNNPKNKDNIDNKDMIETVKILIEYGADSTIRNNRGYSAQDNIPQKHKHLLTGNCNKNKKNTLYVEKTGSGAYDSPVFFKSGNRKRKVRNDSSKVPCYKRFKPY